MTYRPTDWPYLARNRPDELKRTIIHAVERARGNVTQAAAELGLHKNSLQRYITHLRIQGNVGAIRASCGKRGAETEGSKGV